MESMSLLQASRGMIGSIRSIRGIRTIRGASCIVLTRTLVSTVASFRVLRRGVVKDIDGYVCRKDLIDSMYSMAVDRMIGEDGMDGGKDGWCRLVSSSSLYVLRPGGRPGTVRAWGGSIVCGYESREILLRVHTQAVARVFGYLP